MGRAIPIDPPVDVRAVDERQQIHCLPGPYVGLVDDGLHTVVWTGYVRIRETDGDEWDRCEVFASFCGDAPLYIDTGPRHGRGPVHGLMLRTGGIRRDEAGGA